MRVPIIKGSIKVNFICFHSIIALDMLELIWITAWIGIISNGFMNDTMIIINIAPPPSPNADVIVEVKKLAKQRSKNSDVVRSGTFPIIADISDIEMDN